MMTCLICNERGGKDSKISFHAFPKDADRRKLWLDAFRLPPTINQHAAVCSKHFTDDSFVLDRVLYKRRLKNTAVPTLNLVRIFKPHKLFYPIKPFPVNSASKQNTLTATPTIISYPLQQVPTNSVILSPPNILPIKESDKNSNKQSYTVISKDTSSNVSNLDCSSMQDSVKIIQLFVPEKELPLNPVATQDSFVVTPTVKNDPLEEVPSNSFCSMQNASHIIPHRNNQQNFVKQLIAVPCSCGNGIKPAADVNTLDNNRNFPIKQELTSDSERTLVNESQLDMKKPPRKGRIWNPRYVGDVKLEHLDDPKQRKRNWEMAVKKIQEHQKEIKVLRQSNRRLKLHLKSMKELVSNLKKSNTVVSKKCQTAITYPPSYLPRKENV